MNDMIKDLKLIINNCSLTNEEKINIEKSIKDIDGYIILLEEIKKEHEEMIQKFNEFRFIYTK